MHREQAEVPDTGGREACTRLCIWHALTMSQHAESMENSTDADQPSGTAMSLPVTDTLRRRIAILQ
jgi:hypothetical protein